MEVILARSGDPRAPVSSTFPSMTLPFGPSPGERIVFHPRNQPGIFLKLSQPAVVHIRGSAVTRTIRFPATLREKIAADAERCGRSFDGQVVALLRKHYGENVDIAPTPAEILALAFASLADVPTSEMTSLTRKLREPEN